MSEADTENLPTGDENDVPEHIKELKAKEEEKKKKKREDDAKSTEAEPNTTVV